MEMLIHRGAKEIGGSCVELRSQEKSLLLDIGMPLVNADGSRFRDEQIKRPVADLIAAKLLPNVPGLYGDGPCDVAGIVITHSHPDHYGLGKFVRNDVPFYMTRGTKAMMGVSKDWLPLPSCVENIRIIEERWKPLPIGPFTIKAHPVDHSAPDAVALEVEADGKKVFYSGDFRGHGRTRRRFDHIIQKPPRGVDALLMEGSSIGREPGVYQYDDENAVEKALLALIRDGRCAAFLFCSSQNLDRFITAYRCAKIAGREVVIDLYIACILRALGPLSPHIPQFNSERIRVVRWPHHVETLRRTDSAFYDAIDHSGHVIGEDEIVERARELLVVAKANSYYLSLAQRVLTRGPLEVIWSMYSRYLEDDDRLPRFCEKNGITIRKVHSSGHATVEDLKRLAQAVRPKWLVPIHTFHPDDYGQFGVSVRKLEDGQVMTL